MTLLGWVPEENLAESGSNVKSAAESRTEEQNLKRVLDVRLYGWKKVRQLAASPRSVISLIIASDLTFRNRFVNVRRHIILLVSQTLNNPWCILQCDSLAMPFELYVASDELSTECLPIARCRSHNFKQAIATPSDTTLCSHFIWVICMFSQTPEGSEEINLTMCTWSGNANCNSPPDVTPPRLHPKSVVL